MDTTTNHPGTGARRQIRVWRAIAGGRAPGDATGARTYERWRCLPRLIEIDFGELYDTSAETARSVIQRLTRAIARERRRARAGHWSYDADRHIALVRAKRAEMKLLWPAAELETAARPGQPSKGSGGRPADRRIESARARRPGTDQAVALASITGQTASRGDSRAALLTGTKASCDRIMVTARPSSDSGSRSQNCTR